VIFPPGKAGLNLSEKPHTIYTSVYVMNKKEEDNKYTVAKNTEKFRKFS
jgi:hypothetical protein